MSAQQAWYIVDWDEHYEVNSSNRPWKAGEKKRVGPLPYTRRHTFGPQGDNMVYADVAEFSEARQTGAWPVAWGLFNKLLEVTAHQRAELRGFLLGRGGKPLSMRAMERITCFTQEQIELGLSILSDPDVGWLERREIPCVSDDQRPSLNLATLSEGQVQGQGQGQAPSGEGEGEYKVKAIQGEEQGNAETSDKQQPSPSPEDCAGVDSPSLSPQTKQGFAPLLKLHLGWSPRDLNAAQHNGDQTTFEIITTHVYAGDTGPPAGAVRACYAEAKKIGQRQGNHLAMFMAWFKKRLGANGNEWNGKS